MSHKRAIEFVAMVTIATSVSVFLASRETPVSATGSPIHGGGTIGRLATFTDSDCIGNSVVRESSTGDVGIGTTHPQARFLVQGGRFAVNGSVGGNFGVLIANQNGTGPIASFTKSSGTDQRVVIDNDGNVGIGTASPNSPIEVNGVIHTTDGGVMFPDGTLQTTAGGGSGGFRLVSTTTGVNVSESEQIAISPGELFLIVIRVADNNAGNELNMGIVFNGDNDGHGWSNVELGFAPVSGNELGGNSDRFIRLGPIRQGSAQHVLRSVLLVDTREESLGTTTLRASVSGDTIHGRDGEFESVAVRGIYESATDALEQFIIDNLNAGNFDFEIKVYALN